jgi:hypothetical protein
MYDPTGALVGMNPVSDLQHCKLEQADIYYIAGTVR